MEGLATCFDRWDTVNTLMPKIAQELRSIADILDAALASGIAK